MDPSAPDDAPPPRDPQLPPGALRAILWSSLLGQVLLGLVFVWALVLLFRPAYLHRPLILGALGGHAVAQLGTLAWVLAAAWSYQHPLRVFLVSTIGLIPSRMVTQLALLIFWGLATQPHLGALAISFVISTGLGHVIEARCVIQLRDAARTLAPPYPPLEPIPFDD